MKSEKGAEATFFVHPEEGKPNLTLELTGEERIWFEESFLKNWGIEVCMRD